MIFWYNENNVCEKKGGDHPNGKTDERREKCYREVDLTFDHTANDLAFVVGGTLSGHIGDESWGISDVNVYTKSTVTSFAVGNRVNFGSGSTYTLLSFAESKEHLNRITVSSLFDQEVLSMDSNDQQTKLYSKIVDVALLKQGENFTSTTSQDGDVISTSGAFDVVTGSEDGTPWIPSNYKSVDQYLPTPFGVKQDIEVMCAPKSIDEPDSFVDVDFFDYDSMEEGTPTDVWITRNGRPAGVIDCETSFRGQCSQRFDSGAYNINFQHGHSNLELEQTHDYWVLSKEGDYPVKSRANTYADGISVRTTTTWSWKTHPYMCLAYKMRPGVVINMLANIGGYGWRSYEMVRVLHLLPLHSCFCVCVGLFSPSPPFYLFTHVVSSSMNT